MEDHRPGSQPLLGWVEAQHGPRPQTPKGLPQATGPTRLIFCPATTDRKQPSSWTNFVSLDLEREQDHLC